MNDDLTLRRYNAVTAIEYGAPIAGHVSVGKHAARMSISEAELIGLSKLLVDKGLITQDEVDTAMVNSLEVRQAQLAEQLAKVGIKMATPVAS